MTASNYPRMLVWAALALALWFNYEAWVKDYGGLGQPPSSETRGARGTATPGGEGGLGTTVPHAHPQAGPAPEAAPQAAPAAGAASTASSTAPITATASSAAAAPASISVKTDVLDLTISLQGGTLVRAALPQYPLVKGEPEPVVLENDSSPTTFYELQSGLTGPEDNVARPTQLATFSASQSSYELAPGSNELRVPLTWTDGQGITVTKTYVFHRGGYEVGLQQQVVNHSAHPWQVQQFGQVVRNDPPTKRSYFNTSSYAFHGPAIWTGTKYRRLNTTNSDDQHLDVFVTGGWLAAAQHYFVSSVVPPGGVPYEYTLRTAGNEYELRLLGPVQTVAPGETHSFDLKLFVGPKLQRQLDATDPNLDLVDDFGYLAILARPLFWLLQKVYSLFGNWGIAIIVVTFLLKLVFYPLSEASGRSMAKMKTLGPRIKQIQETYKDDREKAGRAMMELYQREKVNPVAGCLPIIIQIPVFLAFYWVLLESAEMRQAPFMGWITDLSSRDPYFILPLIMAGAMFVQYKLNPAPPDPVQARVMMIMPLAMSVMFAFFPAGLVLYWVTNTILSIAQQWNINRRIEAAQKKT